MKAYLKFFAVIVLIAFSFLFVEAKNNEKTGKELPNVVKKAIQSVSRVKFSWDFNGDLIKDQVKLDLDQVVFIENMKQFCEDRGVEENDCRKYGQAFVLDTSYPIYLNGDHLNTPSNFDQVERMYLANPVNADIHYYIGAMLVHEDRHAKGEHDEVICYKRELAFLFQAKKERLIFSPWVPGYIENIKQNIDYYSNNKQQLVIRTTSGN